MKSYCTPSNVHRGRHNTWVTVAFCSSRILSLVHDRRKMSTLHTNISQTALRQMLLFTEKIYSASIYTCFSFLNLCHYVWSLMCAARGRVDRSSFRSLSSKDNAQTNNMFLWPSCVFVLLAFHKHLRSPLTKVGLFREDSPSVLSKLSGCHTII